MAVVLDRKWFPIFYDYPGPDLNRVKDNTAGWCSCRMNVARFFGIEDSKADQLRIGFMVEGKNAIDTTVMDGSGTISLTNSREDGDNKKADYFFTYQKIPRGKSAVMKTGTVNAAKRNKTVSFLFPNSIPNNIIPAALSFILPPSSIDRTGSIAASKISPSVKVGKHRYTIPLPSEVKLETGEQLQVASEEGGKTTATDTLKASIARAKK